MNPELAGGCSFRYTVWRLVEGTNVATTLGSPLEYMIVDPWTRRGYPKTLFPEAQFGVLVVYVSICMAKARPLFS